MKSEGVYCFGIVLRSICLSEFCFQTSSLQLLAGIQCNFIGPSLPRGDAQILACSSQTLKLRVMAVDLLCSMQPEQ
jgi:hypothetical protein